MATESSKYSSVVLTDTFETWRTRTNVMLSAFVANTVTTSNSVHSNGAIAAITHGHGMIRGDIAANNFFANGFIAGGEKGNFRTLTTWTNNTIEGVLVVSNNATFGIDGEDEALFNARIRAVANASFRDIVRMDANVYIGSSNADILQVNAVSTFDGVATFDANTFFNANVSITENLSVTKEVNVTGNGSIGGTFDVTGATDLNSTLNVDGSSTLNGLTVTTFTANGTATLKGAVTLGDAAADKLLVPSHTLFTSNVYVGDATTDKFYVRGHSLFNANVKFTSSADLFSGGTKILNGTGTVLQNLTANTITLKKYTETRVDTTASSTTLALNLNSGMIHKVTLNSSITTFSFTNIPSGTVATGVTLILIQGTGGSKTISWPGTYKFQGGTAPTLSTTEGDIDVLTFFTYDGGTSWLGTTAGLDFS